MQQQNSQISDVGFGKEERRLNWDDVQQRTLCHLSMCLAPAKYHQQNSVVCTYIIHVYTPAMGKSQIKS